MNITETCGDENDAQFITDYHLEQNVASDQSMLEEWLPDIKERTGAKDVYATAATMAKMSWKRRKRTT